MSLMEDKTDAEVEAEKQRKSTKHREDVAKHDQLPPGLKKKKGGKKAGWRCTLSPSQSQCHLLLQLCMHS